MSAWKLVSGGGQVIRKGESDYPDFVRIELRKRDVVEVLREVTARWDGREEASTPIELRVLGQLAPDFTEEKDPVRVALENALEAVETLATAVAGSGEPELCDSCEGTGFRGPFGEDPCPCGANPATTLATMANDTGDARLAQTSAIALSGLRRDFVARTKP